MIFKEDNMDNISFNLFEEIRLSTAEMEFHFIDLH